MFLAWVAADVHLVMPDLADWRRLTAPRAWDRRFRGLKLPERPARSGDELQSSGEPHNSSLPADASSDPLQRSDALKTVFDAR